MVNIINSLAAMLAGKVERLWHGNWDVTFSDEGKHLRYMLSTVGGNVVLEKVFVGRKPLLNRTRSEGRYVVNGTSNEFSPPETKLTNQVRRDKRDLPYLEKLTEWAESYRHFAFSGVAPSLFITRAAGSDRATENLAQIAELYDQISRIKGAKQDILQDLKSVGYNVKDLRVISAQFAGASLPPQKLMQVKEAGIGFPILQSVISTGMLRAIAVIVALRYLELKVASGTIVIDDLGEGLDFERSSRLAELLFDRIEQHLNIQLIATTNDRFLTNAANLKYLTILERTKHVVTAYNYENRRTCLMNSPFLVSTTSISFLASTIAESFQKIEKNRDIHGRANRAYFRPVAIAPFVGQFQAVLRLFAVVW